MVDHVKIIVAGLCLAAAGCSPGPKILTSDPPNGALTPGQIALVDDGSCPAGQIKQVVGGSNRIYGTDTRRNGVPRQASCIPRMP